MSNTRESDGEERIVSVTETGRVTIPEQFREKHGIRAPGRVAFVENQAGELVVRPVGSMREFRGLERCGDGGRPATELLREERATDARRTNELVDRFSDDD